MSAPPREGRQGVPPRRRAAAGNAAVGGPQEQEEDVREGEPHEEGGHDEGEEEEVFAAGLSASGNGEELVVHGTGARVPGRPPGRNACCICLKPWAAVGAHRAWGCNCLCFGWNCFMPGSIGLNNVQCPQCGEQYKYDCIINLCATTKHLRQGALELEEEVSWEFMESALEAIAQRDEVIDRMEEKVARRDEVIAWIEQEIVWTTLDHKIRVYLANVCNMEKSDSLFQQSDHGANRDDFGAPVQDDTFHDAVILYPAA